MLTESSGACSSWLLVMLSVSASDGGFVDETSGPSFRGRNMTYAFTNAEELNFGRQTGSHDAAAELLRMEGEWMVLIKMWRSS